MTTAQIVQLVVSIILAALFGGLAGSWYTNYRTEKRNRVQVIDLEKQVTTVAPQTKGLSVTTSITVSTPEMERYTVERFFIVELRLTNPSNRDFQAFPFGVALPAGSTIISVETRCPDHQHTLDIREIPTGRERYQRSWEAVPFTREETYELVLTVAPVVADRATLKYRPTDVAIGTTDVEVGTLLAGVRFGAPSRTGRDTKRLVQLERRVRAGAIVIMLALTAVVLLMALDIKRTQPFLIPVTFTIPVVLVLMVVFSTIVQEITGESLWKQ